MSGRVVHVLREPYDCYIGRANARYRLPASKWANPYRIGPDGDREDVIAKYEAYLCSRPDLMAALPELRGLVLACWCKGAGRDVPGCHGDVLVRLANGTLP